MFCVASILAAAGGSWLPLGLLSTGAVLMGASVVLGWFVHCREEIGLQSLAAIPWFVVRKIGIYVSLIFNRQREWIKTERD